MKKIEIISYDSDLADVATIALDKEMRSMGFKTLLTTPREVMLWECIRLLKTYPGVPISPMSQIYLEAAREWQVEEEQYKDMIVNELYKDVFLITPTSFMASMLAYYNMFKIYKMLLRKIIVKSTVTPTATIYLRKTKESIIKGRHIFDKNRRTEKDRLRGSNFTQKMSYLENALDVLRVKYNVPILILDIEDDAKLPDITSKIMEFLKQSNLLVNSVE